MMSPFMITLRLKGKKWCNWRERESMSSRVQRLVKLILFIMYLNGFPYDNALLNS